MKQDESDEKRELKLSSPVGGEPLVFPWPLLETAKYSGSAEILDTIRMVMSDFDELRVVMQREGVSKLDSIQTNNFENMKHLCDKYNKAAATISTLWKGATRPGGERWSSERADDTLLRQIHVRAYNRAVPDPTRLNKHYEAFSSQTYGETSFDRMQKILDELKPKERDVFVDLGSGVGNLVLHVAGGSRVRKAYGIEIAQLPVQYAEAFKVEFVRWMKWYGKKVRPFELERGDFLDLQYRDLITKEATIVFINNYAFTSHLEDAIKRDLLSEMKPGTRIISTKPYAPPNRTNITDRRMTDISAMMDVVELSAVENAASWTSNHVAYYLHTINPAKMELHYMSQKLLTALKTSGESSRRSSSSSSSKTRSSSAAARGGGGSSSRESSVASPANAGFASPGQQKEGAGMQQRMSSPTHAAVIAAQQHDDEHAFGPTTRRKWNDYVNQLEKNKKEKKKGGDGGARASSEARAAIAQQQAQLNADRGEKHRSPKLAMTIVGRGRPRKSLAMSATHRRLSGLTASTQSHRTISDAKRTIDMMHEMTCDVVKRRVTTNGDVEGAMHVRDLPGIDANAIATGTCKYPQLEQYIVKMKEEMESHLDAMQTDAYREGILSDIRREEARRLMLEKRVEVLERQVAGLQHDGVLILRQRLGELNMEADTPSALLAQSKEIVAHHKQIQANVVRLYQAHCAALERQNAALDADNAHLASAIAERDALLLASGALAPFGISTELSCDAAKQLLMDNLMQHYRRKRALIADTSALQNEIVALENQPPVGGGNPGNDIGNVPVTTGNELGTATSVTASTTTASVKRSRQRPPRNQATKRAAASAAKQQPADPQKQEEIERQIQDIVAKALSVDSAAKCAEKERGGRRVAPGASKRGTTVRGDDVTRAGAVVTSSPETESADDL